MYYKEKRRILEEEEKSKNMVVVSGKKGNFFGLLEQNTVIQGLVFIAFIVGLVFVQSNLNLLKAF